MEVFVGLVIAFGAGVWVSQDAKNRGMSAGAGFSWGAGVFLLLIVFLPIYLIVRPPLGDPQTQRNQAALASRARVDELEKLAQLKERGFLTEEEFFAKKQQLLGA